MSGASEDEQVGSAWCGETHVVRSRRGEWLPSGWERVTRGVRCRAPIDGDPFLSQLLGWQEVLPPEARWTHLTAARIRGWWLPPLPADLPVYTVHPHTDRVRRFGLVAARRTGLSPYELIAGLRVDPAVDVVVSLARDLSELDLACVVAAALASGSCSAAALSEVAREPGRGMRGLRRVLQRIDHRYESLWEVMLAELHRACGVAVQPQHEVRDPAGCFVARGDLWLVGTQRLHEYDGEVHREPGQHRADLRRESDLGRAGWSRRGYTSRDVLHQAVRILADADHALGRPHDPSRIRPWHTLLRPSLFTPTGRAAFAARFGLSFDTSSRRAS